MSKEELKQFQNYFEVNENKNTIYVNMSGMLRNQDLDMRSHRGL